MKYATLSQDGVVFLLANNGDRVDSLCSCIDPAGVKYWGNRKFLLHRRDGQSDQNAVAAFLSLLTWTDSPPTIEEAFAVAGEPLDVEVK